ncbi:MAG: DMT family transporter [Bacteriovoracia bacterium]
MKAISKTPPPLLVMAALLAVQVLFGLNYVFSKVVVSEFPPLLWASIRIIISAAVLFSVAILSKRPHPTGGAKGFFLPLIGLALLGTIINQGSFLVGLRYTTPTNSAILNTLIPIFTLLVVTLRGQEPLTRRRAVGFAFALVGVLALRKVEDFTLSNETLKGDLLTILNCLSFAFFLSYGKSFFERHDRLWGTAWLFAYGSVGLTTLAFPFYLDFKFPVMTTELWWCAAYAILCGTLLAYFLNNWALAYAKPSQVALWVYVQPVVAALLAWIWFGQAITLRTVCSSLLIFTGLLISIRREKTT